jgi:catechol 2,3-dioxygenase-like lactoylglutathione lyase family enzyme
MLNSTIAFIPTVNPRRAKAFYGEVLELRVLSEDGFAVVFDSAGVMLRVVDVSGTKDFKPAAFTVLGWSVEDVASAVRDLTKRGVTFERFPGMEQDALGVWSSPSGAKIVWFKDPDGNLLSLTE